MYFDVADHTFLSARHKEVNRGGEKGFGHKLHRQVGGADLTGRAPPHSTSVHSTSPSSAAPRRGAFIHDIGHEE